MRRLNFNDLEIEAYTAILVRQKLLERNLKEYQTTKHGNSFLDRRDKVQIISKK